MTETPPQGKRHFDDEGSTTQDLLAARYRGAAPQPAPPAAPKLEWFEQPHAEDHIRMRGRWMIISGISITVLSAALALVWAAGYEDDIPLGVLLPLQAVGLGGVALGCLEWFNRPHRHLQRRCLKRIDLLELAMLDLVGLMDEDRQQQFYRGSAWQARNEYIAGTGTENAKPLNKYRSGEQVLPFRQRGRS